MLALLIFSACAPKTVTEVVTEYVYIRESGGGDSGGLDSQADSGGEDSQADSAGDSAGDSPADSAGDSGLDSQADSGGEDSQADSGGSCSASADPRIVGMDYTCSGNVWIFRWELAGEADRVVVDGIVNVIENGSVAGYYEFQLSSDDGAVNPGCCGELRILADCNYAPWVSVSTEKAGRLVECGYTGTAGGNTTCPANRWQPGGVACQ